MTHSGVVDKLLKSLEDSLYPDSEKGLQTADTFLKKVFNQISQFFTCFFPGMYSKKILPGMSFTRGSTLLITLFWICISCRAIKAECF